MHRRSITAVTVAAATVLGTALVAAAPGADAAPARRAIPNTAPAWLAHAQHLGNAAATARVTARVYVAPNGGMAALRAEALAVSTPGSARYAKFLSAAQYHARFDATASTVAQLRNWLTGAGLRVTSVEAHSRYLSVSGTVASAERAFGVAIERYRHDGLTVQAPAGLLTAPAQLAASVLTVNGLDTTPQVVAPARTKPSPPPAGFRNATPCSSYYGQKLATDKPAFQGKVLPYAVCGYTGAQLASAYEGTTSLTGAGVTVAITDAYAAPTIASDAATYASRHGGAPYAAGQFTQNLPRSFTRVNTGSHQCDATGWYGEETLDVEAVHAMAPAANIRYYASKSCYDSDFLDTFARVNDEDVANIVTNSWGEIEQAEKPALVAAYEMAFLQGATEGISYTFSSGDNGDEVANSGTKQTDYPASDPYVTAVGGTSTAIGADGTLSWETGWGTVKYGLSADGTSWDEVGYLYGAGGGESTVFQQPTYQSGVTPAGARGVPDVAMDADPTTGMLVGETQAFPDGVYYDEYRIGGTSLASPLFAGMTALAIQHAGHGVGLLNPTIYADANSGVFTDVKGPGADAGNIRSDYVDGVDNAAGLVYSVRTFDQDASLTVTPGWDDVTGLGSPNTGWLTALG